MKVSIIICTYSMERFDDIIETVNSLLKQTYKNIEIIVSVDHNKKVLIHLKKTLSEEVRFAFNNEANGLSDTRNAGIKEATGEIIAFIDDDAVADEMWIDKIVTNYTDKSIMAVGGKLIPLWESKRPWWFPDELDWIVGCTYKGHPEKRTEVRNLIGCNMSFRRKVIEKVGFFSTDIGRLNQIPVGCEETEYFVRIKNAFPKSKIIYEPEAVVYHKVAKFRESIKYIFKRSYGEGSSKKHIRKVLNNKNLLSSENNYLKYLFLQIITSYGSNVIKLNEPRENLAKMLVISGAIFATGIGYIKS